MSTSSVAAVMWVVLLAPSRTVADGADVAVPISVPASLGARTASFEPSGLAWAAPLGRYLLVSDDTGPRKAHHQPWLLAMGEGGILDDEPVPILGLAELKDPESICEGPDGTFFVVTSHSANQKGHLPPARRMLLHAQLEGRGLRVIGRVDLTTARDSKGGSLLDIAGLSPDGKLDIEAITYRDGALLIGLKSPLSPRLGAVILRLADPVQALGRGTLASGAITRLWEVQLQVGPRRIAQGIADMTTLPDGSLVLVANSPKGMPSDGGGALYWFQPGAGEPKLLRWFPNQRPEGVTLAADHRTLLIVFDNNDRPPAWMRLPLPGGGPS